MATGFVRTAGDYALAKALFGLTRAVGALPIDRALDTAHAIGTRLGPRASRHKIVLSNLAAAMPELDEAERQRIGREMWGHQARLIVETAYPDRLFEGQDGGERVEIVGAEPLLERTDGYRPPVVFFTGHTGCFEMLAMAGGAVGLSMATLFRPPNNRFVAGRLLRQREAYGVNLVPARGGAAKELVEELKVGRNAAVLVDQKFMAGPKVPFFGIPAPTNGLIVRLAKHTDGTVIPGRCVRLPENRYRIEVCEPVHLPRREAGALDLEGSLALVNGIVERWVREYPAQWMWFHRRWG